MREYFKTNYAIGKSGEVRRKRLAFCKVCGKTFIPNKEHFRYCAACKEELRRLSEIEDASFFPERTEGAENIEYR